MNIFGKDNLGGRKTTGKIYECPDDGKRNDEKRNDGMHDDEKRNNDEKRNDGKRNDGKRNDGKRNDGKRNDVLKRRHKEGMILKPRIEEGHTGIS